MTLTDNFAAAVKQLRSFLAAPAKNDLERAGMIQGFEFTFEQAWKAVQKVAGAEGSQVASPKSAFSFALQRGWISVAAEPDWLQMIKDRNLTSHTYQEALAIEILSRITTKYLAMFEGLLATLSAS